jgi:diketogulonate reductase-like aldo/keto reductase
MERVRGILKRTIAGTQVPIIGQGTWQLENANKAAAIAALRAGLDLGLTHIDTAEMYGSGSVERLVGEALGERRDEVFLVSKVLPSNASRRGTVFACEQSLKRLKTDRLDCYLLHWPGGHPLEDTIAAFEELQQVGKILSYGVSNFDEELVAEAVRIAGPGRIAVDQVLYSLAERHIEHAVLPTCTKLGVALVGYSPFHGFVESEALREVARELSATPRQVQLAFLVREPPLFAIPRSSSVSHTRENAGAGRLKLSPKQIARIDEAHPLRVRRELPMI